MNTGKVKVNLRYFPIYEFPVGPPQADVQLAEAALPAPREQRAEDARRRPRAVR